MKNRPRKGSLDRDARQRNRVISPIGRGALHVALLLPLLITPAAAPPSAASADVAAQTAEGGPARPPGETPLFGTAGELRARAAPARPAAQLAGEVGEFIPGIRVDDAIHSEHREPVAAWGPGGVIYAAYAELAAHWNPEWIMFTRSTDGGLTWRAPAIRVNDTAPNAVIFPAIEVLGDGTILLVWAELKFAPYNYEMRFSRSTDGGDTWSPSRVIHPIDPSSDYIRPSMLVVGTRILVSFFQEVAYPDGRPVLVYSDDGGDTWSDVVTLTPMLCDYGGSAPCLAYNASTDMLGVVVPTHDERICFLSSTDGGETWSGPVQVNDADASSADYPDLAAGAGAFQVVWNDNRNGQYDSDVWISRSTDGESFTPNVKVNDPVVTGNQYEPHIRLDAGGNVHVCWIWNLPFQTNIDLYYTVSHDAGLTWEWPCPRVNDIPYVVQPYVAWSSDLLADSGGGAYLFWNDGRLTDYYDSIYFSRRLDPSGVADDAGDEGTLNAEMPSFSLRVTEQPGADPLLHLRLAEPREILRVELIDLAGRRWGHIENRGRAGIHRIALSEISATWPLPRGAYFVRVRADRAVAARRVLLVR